VPEWLLEGVAGVEADLVVVTPHWGPNMTAEPPSHVRSASAALRDAGAALVAGHSAHVFHGIADGVLYDTGDFLDDYIVDPQLRNDLGLLFLVTFDGGRVRRVEAVPLKLDYCYTALAEGADADWVRARFRRACAELDTHVREDDGRLVVESSAS
jgi:hypothetical protein